MNRRGGRLGGRPAEAIADSKVTLPTVVAVVAIVAQFVRRPEALLRPQFYAEGGPVFYVPTYFTDPLALITSPYGGYLHLIPRLLAYAERAVVPAWAPAIGALLSFLIVAGVAAFLASERLAGVLPAPWQRLALAGMLIATPSAYEILGVEVNIQVYLAAYLAALAMANPPRSWSMRAIDGIGAAAASLSGPFAILLAPLFWLRRDRLAVVVTLCALIQLAVILNAPQRPFGLPSLGDIADVAALRINAAVLGASLGSAAPQAVAVGLAILAATIAFRTPQHRAWLTLGFAALVVAAGGILSDGAGLAVHARWGERFFLLPSLAVTALIVAGLRSPDAFALRSSQVLGILLVIGLAIDFRVPAFRDTDWVGRSECIGGEAPCEVPGEPEPFAIVWPGAGGTYRIPTTRPTDVPQEP